MASFNKILLIGNVTRDPELRMTPTEKKVVSFSIAVNEKRGDDEDTQFFDIEAWGSLADIIDKHVKKGDLIHIDGKGRFSEWPDKDTGKTRKAFKVVAEEITFLSSKKAPAKQDSNKGGKKTSSRK
jgi:single-strand DNA-binding protein